MTYHETAEKELAQVTTKSQELELLPLDGPFLNPKNGCLYYKYGERILVSSVYLTDVTSTEVVNPSDTPKNKYVR